MTPLLLTLLAHGLADFIFQTDTMIYQKNKKHWIGFLLHGITVFITSVLCMVAYDWLSVLLFSGIIAVSHILIDMIKAVCSNRSRFADLSWFAFDQLLHIIGIVLIWQCFHFDKSSVFSVLASSMVTPEATGIFSQVFSRMSWIPNRVLICLIVYVYVCWGGGFFVKKILALFHPNPNEDHQKIYNEHIQNTGFWIGVLERFIILTLVLNNALTAVAFIFTAKSIARYSELNNQTFAEYYLTGTLLSTALGISGGYFLLEIIAYL